MGSASNSLHYENTYLRSGTDKISTVEDHPYEALNITTLSRNADDNTSPEQIHVQPLQHYNTKGKEVRNIKIFVGVATLTSIVATCVAVAAFVMTLQSMQQIVATRGSGQEGITSIGSTVPGNWSVWMSWTECSTSCGIGLTHRRRDCNSPTPFQGIRYCDGDPVEYHLCEIKSCTAENSNWTSWDRWSSCSKTCGPGIRNRLRYCSNPEPSNGGAFCPGNPVIYEACETKPCIDPVVAFSAFNTDYKEIHPGQTLAFGHVLLNEGGSYNRLSGVFTCPHDGIYLFTVVIRDYYEGQIEIRLVVDGISKIGVITQVATDYVDQQNSNSVILRLTSGNKVWLSVCDGSASGQHVYGGANYPGYSTFSGAKLHT